MKSMGFAVGVGINLGDRTGQFELAVRLLEETPGVEVLGMASPIRTRPVVPEGEEVRHPWYLNTVVLGGTTRSPRALLARLLGIETALGRRRRGGCDPRTLDLDLVAFEGAVIEDTGISIPHPRLAGRDFVLNPLQEVLEDLDSSVDPRVVAIARGIRASLPIGILPSRIGS